MFHVVRNPDGSIQSLSKQPQLGSEMMDDNNPEIQQFFNTGSANPTFNETDAEFVRVMEDLSDALNMKNVIRHTDLPVAAQQKMTARKGLRSRLQGALNLLEDDDQII